MRAYMHYCTPQVFLKQETMSLDPPLLENRKRVSCSTFSPIALAVAASHWKLQKREACLHSCLAFRLFHIIPSYLIEMCMSI